MEFDAIFILYGSTGLLIAIMIGYFVGMWQNPYWKCNFLRKLTKKPYLVANLKRKDGVLISTFVVNAERDVITIGSDIWAVVSGTVYLTRVAKKSKNKFEREIIKETGYSFKDSDLKQELGTPTVYLTMDDITTINLNPPTPPQGENIVRPNEVGPTILSWISDQVMKNGMAAQKLIQTLLFVTIFLVLVSAAVCYFTLQKVDQLDKKLTNFQEAVINAKPNLPATQTIQNGTVIIHSAPFVDHSMVV